MLDTHLMEEVSLKTIELIIGKNGFLTFHGKDYGVDFTIRKAKFNEARRRILMSGKSIDIQLKAVLEKHVRNLENSEVEHVTYDLETKNFNDLVDRANENGIIQPLYLITFILPNDNKLWLTQNQKQLIVQKRAFWYQIPVGEKHTENKSTVAIDIPKVNLITLNFCNELFELLD